MNNHFDVRIERGLYDADQGVTVLRISYCPAPGLVRKTLKGVAFCAPEDRKIQSRREGVFQAFIHATDGVSPVLTSEIFLALLRSNYLQEPQEPEIRLVFLG